jgi:hypothetical protein
VTPQIADVSVQIGLFYMAEMASDPSMALVDDETADAR